MRVGRWLAFVLPIGLAGTLGLFALHKPTRVLVPDVFGLTCPVPDICLDDAAALGRAVALRTDAIAFVEARLGPLGAEPRVLFCTGAACASRFGDPRTKASNVGTSGIVINPDGWEAHILRHELIHHWQNERFGRVAVAHRLPRWFVEGMAYALSDDPRRPLPVAEIEGYRARFEAWVEAGGDWRVGPDG